MGLPEVGKRRAERVNPRGWCQRPGRNQFGYWERCPGVGRGDGERGGPTTRREARGKAVRAWEQQLSGRALEIWGGESRAHLRTGWESCREAVVQEIGSKGRDGEKSWEALLL